MADDLLGEQFECRIVVDICVPGLRVYDTAMAVSGVFAKTDITDYKQIRCGFLRDSQTLLDNPVV